MTATIIKSKETETIEKQIVFSSDRRCVDSVDIGVEDVVERYIKRQLGVR